MNKPIYFCPGSAKFDCHGIFHVEFQYDDDSGRWNKLGINCGISADDPDEPRKLLTILKEMKLIVYATRINYRDPRIYVVMAEREVNEVKELTYAEFYWEVIRPNEDAIIRYAVANAEPEWITPLLPSDAEFYRYYVQANPEDRF